ncbi:Anti-sigma-K factor RskA [Brevibacterium siliguriense]|uniref:Anti-sigma-K factor RskA n=1 Tax=Brevibacterium siliguriense TaxID=1136497 RepID=A0A1H1N726_9MICO|nr:anti-sigma factor [Brevibacterium siliguriense]SDR94678.1 Anti-sigma-K factor RskA [Brevibacterium siliguriense]
MSTDRDYLAAGLALGGLSDSELAEARALAESDADFRAEVAAYSDVMAEAAASDEPVEVSSATRDAILSIPENHAQESAPETSPTVEPETSSVDADALTDEPAAPASLAEHREARRFNARAEGAGEPQSGRSSWLPWAAAAAAIVVAAGLGATVWQQNQRQNSLEEDLAATQQQLDDSARLMEASDLKTSTSDLPEGGSVTVLSSESEQLIRLSPKDIGQPPAGKSMQMWVIGADGPESAGLMSGKPVTITGETFASGSVFGITVEPEGGSKQPTTDPIVAIDL